MEFSHFVNGSEKLSIRRKNALVTPNAKSDEKGPKMSEKDLKILIRFDNMLRFEP